MLHYKVEPRSLVRVTGHRWSSGVAVVVVDL
jgi:hypothetical protein